MDSVTLTIDGREVRVEKGKTVLEAAIGHGFQVPYYCYHPALGVDGSCRVCIVKIEKMPKLQTACSTVCTEGMVVHTRTPDVVEARAGVFEFLLINHPLDCPMCDKGGECPLQDFSYTFGPNLSRMEFPRRVFDGEGVRGDVDFGATLMLNRQRCILCSRCVRFMRDVDGDAQIGIVDRGYGSEIATFEERGIDSLLSGNLMDVCPVGAITTRDYRFKSRPWDNPGVVDTICTFCAKGCNTSMWLRAKPEWAKAPALIRVTPRLNPQVNGYWMCDIGRFDYHWIEGENRLRRPLLRDAAGVLQPAAWREAFDRLRTIGSGEQPPAWLVSAHASLEELFLVRQIAIGTSRRDAASGTDGFPSPSPHLSHVPSVVVSWRYREKPQPEQVRFRIPAVDAPNVRGAADLGLTEVADRPNLSTLRDAIGGGAIRTLYVLDPGPPESLGEVDWIIESRRSGMLERLIVQGVVLTDLARAADIVLPGASSAEKDALYTNEQGHVQAAARAIAPLGDAREDWQILREVGSALGVGLDYADASAIRTALAATLGDRPEYQALESIAFARAVPARSWLQTSNPSERWKWDFLFRDGPPVKIEPGTAYDHAGRPEPIPLRKIE